MAQPATMSDPWVPTNFTESDEFKEFILDKANEFPQAFKVLPIGREPQERGTWAQYEFDGVVSLWVNTSHNETLKFFREHFQKQKGKTMSKALTVQEEKQVKTLLANNITAIKSVLPNHLTPEKMLRMAYTAIVRTPEVGRCNQLSLFNCVLEASSLGLEIGGPLSLAHILPFKGEATLVVDYKGLISLAYNSPVVKSFSAHPVYQNDQFEYWYGLNKDLRHIPKRSNRGALYAAYAIVEFKTGGSDFEVVFEEDAEYAKSKSPAKNSDKSPWNKNDEVWNMWVKTAVRKLMKRIPKSTKLQRALDVDEKPSNGTSEHIIDVDFETMENLKTKDASGNTVQQDDKPQIENQEQQQKQSQKERKFSEEETRAINSVVTFRDSPEYATQFRKACDAAGVNPGTFFENDSEASVKVMKAIEAEIKNTNG